jgi:hypothetical protein
MGNLCYAREHSVQFFVQFFTQFNCTAYLRVHGAIYHIYTELPCVGGNLRVSKHWTEV